MARSRLLASLTKLSFLFLALHPAPAVAKACGKQNSDFVIVGGGTAGLALASRLSRGLPDSCILVLEAGIDAPDEPKINIPGLKGTTIGTSYDWNFTTIPQPNANNRSIAQPRGKVLGGSSALNLMTYDRSSSAEYDTWEKLGNPGWNFKNMYQAMLRVENFTKFDNKNIDGVGKGGPIQILVNPIRPVYQAFFIPAMERLGVKETLESLAGKVIGVAFQPTNVRSTDFKRSYSAHNPGYPSIAGDNLQILTSTRVSKINFAQGKGKLVASGVTLEDGSIITAGCEVILCAGSIQSPGLLEISGVGNKDILSSAGIKSLLDLPAVGENLQDHIRTQISFQLKSNYTSYDILKYNATYAAEQLALYNEDKRSLYDYSGSNYAYLNWTQVVGDDSRLRALAEKASKEPLTSSPFEPIRSKVLLGYLDGEADQVPQVEVLFSDGYTGVKGYPAKTDPLYGQGFFTLITAFQHPFSMGSVHITSSSLSTKPRINPNYLGHEYDIQSIIAAAKYIRKLANTEPLKQAWTVEHEPGLDVVGNGPDADEQWRKFVANNTLTIYHPAGTCAMLPRKDGGVVDPNLVVYGTQNVRVVDASIIPNLISAHIQTAVYGIAERAAGIIIGSYTK